MSKKKEWKKRAKAYKSMLDRNISIMIEAGFTAEVEVIKEDGKIVDTTKFTYRNMRAETAEANLKILQRQYSELSHKYKEVSQQQPSYREYQTLLEDRNYWKNIVELKGDIPLKLAFYPGNGKRYTCEVDCWAEFPRDKKGKCAFCNGDPVPRPAPDPAHETIIQEYARDMGDKFETCPVCLGRPT